METKLSEYIKENTISGEYAKNSALIVGKVLGFSRNWVSQNLNDYYNTGALIKIRLNRYIGDMLIYSTLMMSI